MNKLLELPEVEQPTSSIVAPAEAEIPREEPLATNKSQATRMAKKLFGPKARWYKNNLKKIRHDVEAPEWFGIPEGDVILTIDQGNRHQVLAHGKDYDAVLRAVTEKETHERILQSLAK